jgi:hypothetical protein
MPSDQRDILSQPLAVIHAELVRRLAEAERQKAKKKPVDTHGPE